MRTFCFAIHFTRNTVALVAALLLVSSSTAQELEVPSGDAGFESHVQTFLSNYCFQCHGPDEDKAGLSFHLLTGEFSESDQLEQWELMLEVLEDGEMPPEVEPQPPMDERDAIARWIEDGLRTASEQHASSNPASSLRRLTNVEYQNTLRDLLGFELHIIDMLTEDPSAPYEFNNSARFMRIGPEQIDRYLEVARFAMDSAIVDPGDPEVHMQRAEWDALGADRGMALDEIGIWGNRRHAASDGMGLRAFPEHGEFRIRIQASSILPEGYQQVPLRMVMGYPLNRNSSTLQIAPVGTVRLTNSPDDPQIFEFTGRIENFPVEMVRDRRKPDQPPRRVLHITPQNLFDDGTLNDRIIYGRMRNIAMPRVVLNWMEFEAPLADQWPPEYHRRILFDSTLREQDPDKYVREVIARFMTRAYRRPATGDEVERFVQIFSLLQPEFETMEAAMRETLAHVLISPQFLYHNESSSESLEQYRLASRLSYFLWASMPDEELLKLAEQGRLNDPAVLEQQALRMLEDERSAAFIEDFTRQWLSIDKTLTVPINRSLYPRFLYDVSAGERAGTEVPYRPTVRDYMIEETVGFVGELIRRNASVLQVVDSDFAFINQRLAAHYEIADVYGDELRPVGLKDDAKIGGLLTQGAVLIGNGTGSAPHPIYRAVWLREAILGDDVAPPPAEVPALTDSAGESADTALTIAELLERHRTVESCNECHVRLDPWGIPFEHYNAVGRYQPLVPEEGTRVRGYSSDNFESIEIYRNYLASISTVEVSATARVPNGPEINGMEGLKAYLIEERSEDIVENVVRRLMTYSLGRELTYRDRFAVEALMKEAGENEYRFRDIIVSICRAQADVDGLSSILEE
ncbi:MAG: DUF1592 domain-containing protein [Planctomycetota bacterium]